HPTVSPANATQDYLDNDGGKGTTIIRLTDSTGTNHDGYFVLADYITMYPDLVTAAVGYNQATTDEGRIKALFSHYKTNGYKEDRTIVFPAKAIADAAAQTATIAAAQSAAVAQNQASLIAKATYGMPNVAGSLCTTWVDIPTAQVIALAGSKTPVTWTSLGLSADPAPGIIKTLMVYYHNGQSTKVPYGGTLAATPTGTTIIGASFGCGTLMDVTAAVKNIVAIKSSATASSTTFGADQGLGKTLTIYFNNGDSPVTISDGQAINASITSAQAAAAAQNQISLISKATYGVPNAAGSSCTVWGDVPAAQVIALAGSKTPVTWTSLGLAADPAPGIIKTLIVYYNNGLAVRVPYGGTLAATPAGTTIIGANFGCGTLMDVTAAVKNIVVTNSSATATDITFGANPGTGKMLTIYFTNRSTPWTIAQGQG
ncbi:MAG: hypothetical protein P4M14_13695, partial [Gammaproteobacteria bacterium]|nr:hypothetical protein [Gammaproteobacteria bacterium]